VDLDLRTWTCGLGLVDLDLMRFVQFYYGFYVAVGCELLTWEVYDAILYPNF
jgi:hypothetical protein